MKLIKVNLRSEQPLKERLLLPGISALMIAALVLTVYTASLYLAGQREITASEEQIKSVRNLADDRQKRKKVQKMDPAAKEALYQDSAFIKNLLLKKMLPVSEILDDIEISRPEKLRIDLLEFSQDFNHMTIKGKSDSAKDVSAFLLALDATGRFTVHINRGEIDEQKKIHFDITLDRQVVK